MKRVKRDREMNDEWEGSRSEGKRDQGREKGRAELIKGGGG